jgi:hypothetical protein
VRPRGAHGEISNEVLVRYLQGEMTRSESEETERLIADSRRAQARLAELRAMTEMLRQPPDWVKSVDLTAAVEQGIQKEAPPAPRRALWLSAGMAVAAAAAVIAVVSIGPSRSTDGSAPRAKGGGPTDPDRWVGVSLQGPDRAPVGERIPAGGLVVSYTNLGPRPYSHLMVFAVDAAGEVRWFYPAYQDPSANPAAIEIEPGASDRILPELVEHDFAPGPLTLCGLFVRHPLTVREVEAALGGRPPAAGRRLPFPGSGQHCVVKVVSEP